MSADSSKVVRPASARPRHPRFQPQLVFFAAIVALPVTLTGPSPAWVVAMLVGGAVLGAGVWLRQRRRPLSSVARERVAGVLAWLTIGALLALLVAEAGARPQAYVMLASAQLAILASAKDPRQRLAMQAVVIGAVGVALAMARPIADVLFVTAALAVLAVLAGAIADQSRLARERELVARHDAERRAGLLAAVRLLPGRDVESAARAVVTTMRELGFDASGVSFLGADGNLHDAYTENIPPVREHPPGSGMIWRAMEENATVATGDYRIEGYRLPERGDVRSAIATPLRVRGRPVGVLVGARHEARPPTPGEHEVAEVLAAHLGVALETEQLQGNQRVVLQRMDRLDRLRGEFLGAVSAELRDPLTTVRGLARILRVHGEHLDDAPRLEFLDSLCDRSAELGTVIDSLLDFSRSSLEHDEPLLVAIPAGDLLDPATLDAQITLASAEGTSFDPGAVVHVAPSLIRSALELLAASPGTAEVAPLHLAAHSDRGGTVRITVRRLGPPPSALLTAIAARLVVAGGGEFHRAIDPVLILGPVGRAAIAQPSLGPPNVGGEVAR